MVRAQQLRSARLLRVGVAYLSWLASTVAKELEDSTFMEWFTCVDGALGIDLLSVSARTMRCSTSSYDLIQPMGAGWIHTPTACPVGIKLIGDHARTR